MLDLDALARLDEALADAVAIEPVRTPQPAARVTEAPQPVCPHLARMAAE